MYTYVSKKRIAGPKAEIERLLAKLVKVIEKEYGLQASIMTVGSARTGLITGDESGHFDFDYNICFSKVPQEICDNYQKLKDRVRTLFDRISGDTFLYGKGRKPVIRFEHAGEDYSLDLGILVKNKDKRYCRLVYEEQSGRYLLQEIALLYNASIKENYIINHNSLDRLRAVYLKNKNKSSGVDSFHNYLDAINTVYNEKGGQKLSKVSGNNHSQRQMDNYANQKNPNNSASKAAANNRANQMNPNNPAYAKSNGNK